MGKSLLSSAGRAKADTNASSTSPDVVGLGEISLDRVLAVDGMPKSGSKREVSSQRNYAGGQIATAVLGCRRLGLDARLLGAVGRDAAGDSALAPLREAGVDLSLVRVVAAAATRTATILVDRSSGERSVLWHRDQGLRLDIDRLDTASVASARVLLVDTTDPEAACWAAEAVRRAGGVVILDADAPWPQPEHLLRLVDFPVIAGSLAEEWGRGSVWRGLRELAVFKPRLAVATLGADGAIACGDDGCELVSPAFAIRVRDTTGAGDAFRAGFAYGLLAGFDAEQTLRAANAAAAINCEHAGAQGGLASCEQLEKRLLDP